MVHGGLAFFSWFHPIGSVLPKIVIRELGVRQRDFYKGNKQMLADSGNIERKILLKLKLAISIG